MLEQNKGKVKIVFKHFPLQRHELAVPAALATIAAHNQGKFWELHDAIFAAKGKLDPKSIERMGAKIGLDMKLFTKDLKAPETRQRLEQDIINANKVGVDGTPNLYINGRKVNSLSMETVQKMIDMELAEQKRK